MDFIFKLILWIIGILFVSNTVVKKTTGKHIHEHIYEWWNKIREAILNYRRKHQYEEYDFVVRAVEIFDNAIIGMKRAGDKILEVYSANVHSNGLCQIHEKVTEEVVSVEQLYEQFPMLRNSKEDEVVIIEI